VKVDVIVATYWPDHEKFWPAVRDGIIANLSWILNVYVVSDGVIKKPDGFELPWNFISTPKREVGIGLSHSLNVGLEQTTADYILIIEGDEILEPGSIEKSCEFAEPGKLIACPKRYVDPDDYNKILEEDHRTSTMDW